MTLRSGTLAAAKLLNQRQKIWLVPLFCLCCFCHSALGDPSHAYIALYVLQKRVDSFYGIFINDKNQPFLPIAEVAKKWLAMQVDCDPKKRRCQLSLEQKHIQLSIDYQRQKIFRDGKAVEFPQAGLLWRKHRLWLRYDLWQAWLPVKATWSLASYALYLDPDYLTPDQLHALHELDLNQEKIRTAQQEKIAAIPAQVPGFTPHAELRYALNWQNPLLANQGIDLNYDTNVDIFKGTLAASGSLVHNQDDNTRGPIFWNYTQHFPGVLHQVQIGDTLFNGGLLVPSMSLRNSLNITRLRRQDNEQGFVYLGTTLPGSEVDVYRNSILINILRAGSDGAFSINIPSAIAGDQFVLRIYHRDGTVEKRIAQMPEDDEMLLKKQQWDTHIVVGRLSDRLTSLSDLSAVNDLSFSYSDLRYGLLQSLTAGLNYYQIGAHQLSGIDLMWQASNSLNLRSEVLRDNTHTDYATRLRYTGIPDHHIVLEGHVEAADSPLRLLSQRTFFSDLPFDTIFNAPQYYWSLTDNIDFSQWQVSPEIKVTDLGSLAGASAYGNINEQLNTNISAGIARPKDDSNSTFVQASLFYILNAHQVINLSQRFLKDDNETLLSYRYQSLERSGWDFTLGLTKPQAKSVDVDAQIDYRFNSRLSTSLFADRHHLVLQLSLLGIIAHSPGPDTYDQFASGTVAGEIVAPSRLSGGKPTPVANAIVSAGNRQTQTDDHGHFILNGLPTHTRLQIVIQKNSLDASLIPPPTPTIVRLRPGSVMMIHEQLEWTSGIDGEIKHQGKPLPDNSVLELVDTLSQKVIATTIAEDNGFFIMERIPMGQYQLRLKDHPQVHKTLEVKQGGTWQSDLKLDWSEQKNATHPTI